MKVNKFYEKYYCSLSFNTVYEMADGGQHPKKSGQQGFGEKMDESDDYL